MDRRLDEVPDDCEVREQVEVLEHHADLRPHGGDGTVAVCAEDAADFVAIGDFAVDADAALLGHLKVIDAAQQRGLAAAGGADDADDLAGGHRKIDTLQHMQGAEILVQAFDLDHRPGLLVVHGCLRR